MWLEIIYFAIFCYLFKIYTELSCSACLFSFEFVQWNHSYQLQQKQYMEEQKLHLVFQLWLNVPVPNFASHSFHSNDIQKRASENVHNY